MRILLILIGVLLLLPGACGAFFTIVGFSAPETLGVLLLSLPSLALGILGIWLIVHNLRKTG